MPNGPRAINMYQKKLEYFMFIVAELIKYYVGNIVARSM